MAVRIRLRRVGAKKQPSYRVVIADSRSPRDGRFIDVIGFYNPRTKPTTITIDAEKARKWLSHGAKPTESVASLLYRAGIVDMRSERYRQYAPASAAPGSAPAAQPSVTAAPAPTAAAPAPTAPEAAAPAPATTEPLAQEAAPEPAAQTPRAAEIAETVAPETVTPEEAAGPIARVETAPEPVETVAPEPGASTES